MFRAVCLFVAGFLLWSAASAQTLDPGKPAGNTDNALTNPAYSPGAAFLFDLEAKFAADTAKGGGAAFAKWFADDGVTLSNGQAPLVGEAAIAASTKWAPADYQLTWTPEGGRMSPAGDMGFTWGHYEGHFKNKDGSPGVVSGRYMTVWKKQADGSWKVALDASNNEPPKKEDCCKLP